MASCCITSRPTDNQMSEKPTAEDWSLPGKYGEIFREVERDLQRFRNAHMNESSDSDGQTLQDDEDHHSRMGED
jgi:hypothetical protein